MAEVVVAGAGMIGLTTSLLLADDGHTVTVLERDSAEPPDAQQAWEQWERRGVNQFRQLHYLQPRWRQVVEAELPAVVAAMDKAGAARLNPMERLPAAVTGGLRDGDDELTALTARRPVAEAAVASVVVEHPGIEIRRGTSIAALVTGSSAVPGVPHVTGVRTEQGDVLSADVVVDATGRRSVLPDWLEAIGARRPHEEEDDLGFLYYGRHFRSPDGSLPAMAGPLLQVGDSVSVLTLPADNGTWGVGVITSAADRAMRALKDVEAWTRVARTFAPAAHWLDAEPISDGVAVMARIPDRYRRFVVDGAPVATGLVAVGDAWACTNPSVGRGISIGTVQAVALRDLLAAGSASDPAALAAAWDATTEATVTPLYRATNRIDRDRLAEIAAEIDGRRYDPGDPQYEISKAFLAAARRDPDVLRCFLRIGGLLSSAEEELGRPGIFEKVVELGSGWRDLPPFGASRAELLGIVAG